MFTSSSSLTRLRRRLRLMSTALPAAFGVVLLGHPTAHGKPVPGNLGNGLDKLVASNLAVAAAVKSGSDTRGFVRTANNKLYTDAATAAVASHALGDGADRVLVRITLDGLKTAPDLKTALEGTIPSVKVTAVDTKYRGVGVMNAYVNVDDVPRLAGVPGVMAVILEWKPRHHGVVAAPTPVAQGAVAPPVRPGTGTGVQADAIAPTVGETLNKIGTTFDQGVTQHGIDQINKFYNPNATLDLEGQGMQIACISNSFAANASGPASVDVTNGDLPGGASNNSLNTTPVFVYQDDLSDPFSDDEGRGMCQIAYKMAPKATIGFATADTGEVGLANNIRGLAGLPGYAPTGQTFAADTICDDVGYYDEPFFQDGIIAGGITDVYNAGVSYFSSASNDIGTNGYDSDTRWVANGTGLTAAGGNTALKGTNIDLTGVPANLYAGGFHNFNPAAGQLDVAQNVNDGPSAAVPLVFQWNDPYDQSTTISNAKRLFSANATFITQPVTFTVPAPVTAGTQYQVTETHVDPSNFDGIVTVYKSDGTTILAGPQDNGQDEIVRFVAPADDTGFVVKVDHYSITHGPFTLTVDSYQGFSTPPVSTSLSVLVFDVTGAYLPESSLTLDATQTNEPIQIGFTYSIDAATRQVQYVIARSVVPAAGFNYPTHLRYLLPGDGFPDLGPAEYFTYNTVTTSGHEMANTCNGCAAYSVFRPSLPEYFTSPGPATVYYDTNDNRLATPDVRLQPRFAFADGANVSANLSTGAGFAGDDGNDPDVAQGQFYGTSAAGPHAAAIAALVLQKHGGRRSVTPAQMTSILERSTLPHDLDPNFSSGSARVAGGTTGTGKVAIAISSDDSADIATDNTGLNDTTAFTVSYVGGSSITSLVFNPQGALTNAGNVSGGNNGVTYNAPAATIGGTVTCFENSLPGVVFMPNDYAFTLNTTLPDSVTGATAAGSNANGANATQFKTLAITVPGGSFPSSKTLRFTVGRGLAFASTVGAKYNAVTNATTGAAYYCADIFGGGVILPEGTVNAHGMTFSGTTADGGTFTGTIVNNIGKGWAKTDGFGFVNAPTAVNQTVQ